VVLREEQLRLPVHARRQRLQLLQDGAALEQLVLHPQRQRLAERGEAARREGEIGLEQPLELEERLVVESHAVELPGPHAGDLQAGADGVVREGRVVLAPRKALLLRGGRDPAVDHQRGRAVVVVGRDAEDLHFRTACR
jgi:hypothetical protein